MHKESLNQVSRSANILLAQQNYWFTVGIKRGEERDNTIAYSRKLNANPRTSF